MKKKAKKRKRFPIEIPVIEGKKRATNQSGVTEDRENEADQIETEKE